MSENARKTNYTGLARRLNRISPEHKKVAIEMTASLAGVSLRVSKTFVEATPKACKVLTPEDLRSWAEMGRKLAMMNAESGAKFFGNGVSEFKKVPENARHLVFQICMRQLVLSSSTAIETFEAIPELSRQVVDGELFTDILRVAHDVANRSAKHSSDFLKATPKVAKLLEKSKDLQKSVINLAGNFATRTGGMTADLWNILPDALSKISSEKAVLLTEKATDFLEYGGSVTLHFVSSGSEVLNKVSSAFEAWCDCLRLIAKSGNAVLISFIRTSPNFFIQIAKQKNASELAEKVLNLTAEIAETDSESALACFKSSASALKKVSLPQYEEWVRTGLAEKSNDSSKARRSFFALETRQSNTLLQEAEEGLSLDKVSTILRIYIEGLTGKSVEISPLSAMPQESRIGDGKTIYLPSNVNEFQTDEMDFRLYKVLAAHAAGQIEFGTFEQDSVGLKAVFTELSELYEATAEQTDAFSLAGYIENVQSGEKALSEEEFAKQQKAKRKKLPKNSNYRAVLDVFPEPRLAGRIFGTMENARIDSRLRAEYRGLRKD
ncbi:MAG: hypothetical protein MUC29_07495, partial [Pyrinomonadaceae bacterium]|nr:hypothetical protein [Pyrinomonadaceae bacterium]